MNKSYIKVSVIVPTYKRANLVCLTLDSLLEQDFPKDQFEVIVVDNNSPDNTTEVIDSYFENHEGEINIRYVKEIRPGDGYARNTGAALAKGKYLFFCDDDSLFDKNWISCVVELFELYPNVGVIGTRILIKWDKEPPLWIKNYEYLLAKSTFGDAGYIIKSQGFYIANCSLAIPRVLFYKVGGNNPGQIGDWLVGNAEVGLCQKVMKLGVPMAFTDDTCMWHLQQRDKNGTYKDILRRLKNVAISQAYSSAIVKGELSYRSILRSIYKILRAITRFDKNQIRTTWFNYIVNKTYNQYLDKYQHDTSLINMAKSTDHNLDENYIAPEPTLSIEYQHI